MELGYCLLAEAFIRRRRLDDAFLLLDKVPGSKSKSILLSEIRNNAVKAGNLDLYKKVSIALCVSDCDFGDMASILLTNVISKKLGPTIEIINMLPSGEVGMGYRRITLALNFLLTEYSNSRKDKCHYQQDHSHYTLRLNWACGQYNTLNTPNTLPLFS